MQFLSYGSQEGAAPSPGQSFWVDHQPRNGGFLVRKSGSFCFIHCFVKVHTLLLEPQFQQRCDQQGIELNRDAFLTLAEQVQSIQRALQEPEINSTCQR